MSGNHDAKGTDQPPAKKQKIKHGGLGTKLEEETSGEKDIIKNFPASDDKYNDFVTPEEVEKLREFRVLDEVKSNDEDSNGECDESDSSTGESVDLPEEEIEKMLEEDLPADFKAAPKPKEKAYVTREKIILEEKGVNHFEVLPLDWIMIRHQSGMPVYVHRATRVCTLSKPYFLGKGNAKRHDIPISAIPCLAYRRALEEEERQKKIDEKIEEQIKLGTWNVNNQTDNSDANSSLDKKVSPKQGEKGSKSETQSKETSKVSTDKQPNENKSAPQATCPFSGKTNGDVNWPTANIIGDTRKDKSTTVVSPEKEGANATKSSTNAGQTKDSNGSGKNVAENSSSVDNVEIPLNRQPIVLPGGMVMPSPRVETVNTSWKTQHLTHEQVNNYCKNLFKFKVLSIMHFKRWADRRKYTKARKALQYPMLPEGTKLITIPVKPTSGQENSGGKSSKRDWVMNMNGRSYLSVFHEYVRRALQKQPVYEFKQLENASTPYQATVVIGGMQYGVGHGSSKRQAKSAAARASIHILIPEMRDHLEPDNDAEPDFVFFDYVGIEDPRIAEFCAATCEPTPHAILRTCLLRNFGAGDRHIHTEMKKLEYQKIELTMKVGKHSATVVCKNKKTAKQRASQAILQALHPHVRSWGSLLRLYGSRSVKSCKEKKLEEQQITLLQDKARHNEPNYAVLEKLRHEMRKLRERDAAVVPVGTLLLAADLPTHSGSNLNNVEL